MTKINFKRTTKRHKLLRALPIFALALIMSLAGVSSVFAANGDPVGGGTDADHQIAVAITKAFQMPKGTTTPAATFNFTAAKVSYEGDTTATGSMPDITPGAITYTSGEGSDPATGDVKTLTKQTGNIFSGVNWGRTGLFTYTITEASTSSYSTAATTPDTDSVTYSGASYTLNVLVKQDSAGNYYVSDVSAIPTADDSGTAIVDADATKVDPTPGDEDPSEPGHDYSGLAFTNTYTYTKNGEGEDPEDPGEEVDNAALTISSAVAGDMADAGTYFPYSVTIDINTLDSATSYNAYIVNAANEVITPAAGNGAPDGVLYYTFTDGVAKTVNLKAGEKLVFITLPVGTGWTAVDTLGSATPFSSYTATGSVNGSAITGGGTAGVSLSTGSQIVSATASNLAAFINDYTSQPLTGIIINNLPYILLVLLAIAILAAYVVGRSRRRRYDAE